MILWVAKGVSVVIRSTPVEVDIHSRNSSNSNMAGSRVVATSSTSDIDDRTRCVGRNVLYIYNHHVVQVYVYFPNRTGNDPHS